MHHNINFVPVIVVTSCMLDVLLGFDGGPRITLVAVTSRAVHWRCMVGTRRSWCLQSDKRSVGGATALGIDTEGRGGARQSNNASDVTEHSRACRLQGSN